MFAIVPSLSKPRAIPHEFLEVSGWGKIAAAERHAVLVFRLPYASTLAFAQALGLTTRAFGDFMAHVNKNSLIFGCWHA
jgi:hypothetical protein